MVRHRAIAAAFASCCLGVACQSIVGIETTVAADADGASTGAGGSGEMATGTGGSTTGGPQGSGGSGGTASQGGSAGSVTGCTPGVTIYYADGDRDGHGDPAVSSMCPSGPGNWVTNGDDCNDNDRNVHPGQTDYFGTGFMGGSTISFDYDCDGVERADPMAKRATPCDLVLCTGSGFDPATPTRSGPGVDPYCGSHQIRSCTKVDAVTCNSMVIESTNQTYGCH